ncbi:transporter [Zavarzinia compransoris]|uniref:Transporter n=1 Tax=Zavarzinia compransoris TaxID=1264899 RepID=A0A317E638_9PROT|nr:transporter [Zavarzinia compransoris]PWR21680.1 transporter [Zavarzinia compransoris]TDP45537.1 outer membrane putative beta-barrel porin/alpha-amylase [Zavarzinia compransoris]
MICGNFLDIATRTAGKTLAPVAAAAALVFGGGTAAPTWALDLDADDYAAGAVPEGTTLALLYYQYAKRTGVYADGNKVADGDLTSNVGILRVAHFVKIGPFLADPQFLLPFGRLEGTGNLDGLGTAEGIGDLILTSTFWLYNRPEDGVFFGVTPAVFVPTGNYDGGEALNLGENRWKYMLQAAGTFPLFTPDLSVQLSADVTFFGDNNDLGPNSDTLSQKPLGQFQAWLRYSVTPDFDLRAGVNHFIGGETEINGIAQNNEVSTTNFRVGFGWSFAPSWNLVALYGNDAAVENGLREGDRINLRFMKAF